MIRLFLILYFVFQQNYSDYALTPIVLDTPKHTYVQVEVLNKFRSTLYELKKHYKIEEQLVQYKVAGNKPVGFFVIDLTDTLNSSINGNLKFKEGHVYHFAPNDPYFSYSNICYLSKGKIIIFKGINCKDPVNNLNEVVSFLNDQLPKRNVSKDVIERVKTFRNYRNDKRNDLGVCKCELG